ncbi:UBX domain-containing protein 8-like [Ptychodera flava]|uniref:UBX domain-containing protein 8-like n=1 Tax=Ptychodera flava TaxID=63121 RepID=UPI00396A152A
MAEVRADWAIFIAFSAVIGSLVFFQSDGTGLLHILVFALLCLGVTTFAVHIFSSYLGSFFKSSRKEKEKKEFKEYDKGELDKHREESRKKLQENHFKKAAEYDERITQPRRLAKEKEREEQFYKFLGPAWKGEGHKLGTNTDEKDVKVTRRSTGSSKDAAAARVLPESVTSVAQPPVEIKEKREKKRIILPEEPAEGSPQSITIALKSPLGRVHKRRFLYTHKIQILVNYMITLGFHPKIYCICTTYPRKCMTNDLEKTMEDIGLTTDIALVIEEREETDKD